MRLGPALAILDNLETPWEGRAAAVEDVLERLAAIPNLVLMASIRGSMRRSARPGGRAWRHCGSRLHMTVNFCSTSPKSRPRIN